MGSLKLKVMERVFPSRGRARINEVHLKALGINEGDEVEISAGTGTKPVVVTVYADTLVEEGLIRLSPEDIAEAGAVPGGEVVVTRVPPMKERAAQAVGKVEESIGKGIESVKKKLGEKDL
ncbi:MAG: hypothetical protein QXL43_00995 [Methanolinea sp.]|nr:hypothetical protein [Methanolinea sp.]